LPVTLVFLAKPPLPAAFSFSSLRAACTTREPEAASPTASHVHTVEQPVCSCWLPLRRHLFGLLLLKEGLVVVVQLVCCLLRFLQRLCLCKEHSIVWSCNMCYRDGSLCMLRQANRIPGSFPQEIAAATNTRYLAPVLADHCSGPKLTALKRHLPPRRPVAAHAATLLPSAAA
jgi:hypothetical protein